MRKALSTFPEGENFRALSNGHDEVNEGENKYLMLCAFSPLGAPPTFEGDGLLFNLLQKPHNFGSGSLCFHSYNI